MSLGTEQRTFTWGAVAWCINSMLALEYETEAHNMAIHSQRGRTSVIPVPNYGSQAWSRERPQRWELICSIAAWSVWRARCTRVFEGRGVPPAETVRDFWTEIIEDSMRLLGAALTRCGGGERRSFGLGGMAPSTSSLATPYDGSIGHLFGSFPPLLYEIA